MRYRVVGIILASWLFVICNNYDAMATDFGPFSGKVVDADTKEPIEGVVVLVEWWKVPFGMAGSIFLDAQETVTDKEGNFYLSGIWVFKPWNRFGVDASITIFKNSYQAIETGAFRDWRDAHPKREGVLKVANGKPVFILKKLTMEERRKRLVGRADLVPNKKQRLLIKELNKEYKELGISLYPEEE